jgi:hypothetical protein
MMQPFRRRSPILHGTRWPDGMARDRKGGARCSADTALMCCLGPNVRCLSVHEVSWPTLLSFVCKGQDPIIHPGRGTGNGQGSILYQHAMQESAHVTHAAGFTVGAHTTCRREPCVHLETLKRSQAYSIAVNMCFVIRHQDKTQNSLQTGYTGQLCHLILTGTRLQRTIVSTAVWYYML